MRKVLVFGEVLFDVFPDDTQVLGGAPFNFAWHLHGFGYQPLLLTALGTDPLGSQVLAAMQEWGLDCAGVLLNDDAPTGQVLVKFEDGHPSYLIDPSQAWGEISYDSAQLAKLGSTATVLYHGSLALWSEQSRLTLNRLIADNDLLVFVDLNLRPPWWEIGQINDLLSQADFLKLNDQELETLCQILDGSGKGSLEEQAGRLLESFDLKLIIVTRGEEGAFCLSASEGIISVSAPKITQTAFVDSVGAGDAFSAICLIGLLEGWRLEKTLERAADFAAKICTVKGATSNERALYQAQKVNWER